MIKTKAKLSFQEVFLPQEADPQKEAKVVLKVRPLRAAGVDDRQGV